MSRSSPQKRKPRSSLATAQIVCEGFTEEAFCKHLKTLYARDCGVHVTIHNARGGSPQHVVRDALQRKGYDRTIVFFDADKPLPGTWRKKSLAAGHYLIISEPCIEGLLLAILGQPVPDTTEACKRTFESVLSGNTKCNFRAYEDPFPPSLLTACNHPHLQTLLSAFKGLGQK